MTYHWIITLGRAMNISTLSHLYDAPADATPQEVYEAIYLHAAEVAGMPGAAVLFYSATPNTPRGT
jgi:hypothetical protein